MKNAGVDEKLIKLNYKVTIIDNLSTGRLENIKKFKKKIKFFIQTK